MGGVGVRGGVYNRTPVFCEAEMHIHTQLEVCLLIRMHLVTDAVWKATGIS